MVASKQKEIIAAERAKVHNFDSHSKSIWRVLAAGDRVSGSKAYDASTDALTSIEGSISITLENTPAHASFGTNKSALLTLRKMGKDIALSGPNAMTHEIDQSLTDDEPLENAMLNIVKDKEEDDKRRMRQDTEWVEKWDELLDFGGDRDLFGSLEEVLKALGVEKQRASWTTDTCCTRFV